MYSTVRMLRNKKVREEVSFGDKLLVVVFDVFATGMFVWGVYRFIYPIRPLVNIPLRSESIWLFVMAAVLFIITAMQYSYLHRIVDDKPRKLKSVE